MTNFAIFGMDRSGSTLLVSLLNSHPAICCEPEILRRSSWRRPLRPLLVFWRQAPYSYFLFRSHYMRLRTRKANYGFKVFPGHVARPRAMMQRLQQQEWRILHIQRRSLFQQTLSRVVSSTTQRWHGTQKTLTDLLIDPDVFHASLVTVFEIRQEIEQSLQAIPHLDIVYEDDLEDPTQWTATVNRIFLYLDILPAPAHTKLTKPWSLPYSKMITNYDELVQVFEQSGLARHPQ